MTYFRLLRNTARLLPVCVAERRKVLVCLNLWFKYEFATEDFQNGTFAKTSEELLRALLCHFTAQTLRASVWERTERPTESLEMSSQATEDNSKKVEDLQKQLQELRVQREFGLQRFAGSDDNIRFYTRYCFG